MRKHPSSVSSSCARSQLFKCIAVEAKLDDVLEIVAKGLGHQIQDKVSVVHEEYSKKKEEPKPKAYFTYPPDTILDTGEDGCSGYGCDAPDDDDLNINIVSWNGDGIPAFGDDVKALVDLDGTKSKTCADSKQSSNNRKGVNKISRPAEYLFSNERVETGLHGEWQSEPVRHEGQQ